MIASPGASYYTIAVIIVDQEHLVQKCVGGDTRTPGKSMLRLWPTKNIV